MSFTIGFFLMAASWSLLTPIGGAPDEPAHIIRAAAVTSGQVITPAWVGNPAYGAVEVPSYIAELPARACFAFDDEVTPDCYAGSSANQQTLQTTGTSAALNSPIYYWLVGWPSVILSGDVAIFTMRIVSAALTAAFLGVSLVSAWSVGTQAHRTLAMVFVGLSPALTFLAGSVNPNALEATSAAAVYLSSRALFHRWQSRRDGSTTVVLHIALACSLLVLLNTRSIGFLWAALALLLAYLPSSDRPAFRDFLSRRWIPLDLIVIGVTAASLSWLLLLPDYDQSGTPTIEMTGARAALEAVMSSGALLSDAIGMFGWLDTPAPAASIALWSSAAGVSVVVSVLTAQRSALTAALAFFTVAIATPVAVQAVIADELGYIWQGRYALAPLLCTTVALAISVAHRARQADHSSRLTFVLNGAVIMSACAHIAIAIHVLRRYVTGLDRPVGEFLTAPAWTPPFGITALLTALLIATSFTAATCWVRRERAD
ncbi:putative membrane protein DUF2142 [Microcella putealis]|uniref:Putative membrane protein DUF2142 n=1 Tax=Microcella putealis TaxID=337005 RepID=A0A4Q7LSX5_9MICO|nr:putative membrane protein DUF2142 [Microcella putealis]TQM19450.1 putative membrane protein DUF2142 [Microcella putealis]